VVAARGKAPRSHRFGEEAFGFRVDRAEALDLRDGEIGVHASAGRDETRAHSLPRGDDAVAHVRGGLATILAKTLEWDARNVNAKVDAIEHGARELASIALDLVG
jgi:hypothetical protein